MKNKYGSEEVQKDSITLKEFQDGNIEVIVMHMVEAVEAREERAAVRRVGRSRPRSLTVSRASHGSNNLTTQLERLAALRERGVIDEEEFKIAKRKLLSYSGVRVS
jgi:hypothetical protein